MTETQTAIEAEGEGFNWLEVVAALLLGVAGVLTAYAAYYGALAGGDALKGYTESTKSTSEANGYYNEGDAIYNGDQSLFVEYQLLVEQGNQDTADVLKDNLFSDALTAATDAWLEIPAGEGPLTPLDMPEYVIESYAQGDELSEEADAKFAAAAEIDDQGDNFDLASVYLAVALFFAGIGTLFKVRKIQIGMLIFAGAMLIPGLMAIAKGKGWA